MPPPTPSVAVAFAAEVSVAVTDREAGLFVLLPMVASLSTNAFVPPPELALEVTIAPARSPPAPPDAGATAVLLWVARTVTVVPGLWMFAPDEIEAESVALTAESPSVFPQQTRLITTT